MASVSDKQLPHWHGFPAGINNTAALTRVPRDEDGNVAALRDAVNLDLDATGRPRLKRGFDTVIDGAAHSLFPFGDMLLGWHDGAMHAYADDGSGLRDDGALVPGLGDRFITYASDDFSAWWSTDTVNGRIAEDRSLHPFWIDTPAPVTLSAYGVGGLAGGSYEVSVTAIDAEGRESGASAPAVIQVPTGGGIAVTLPAAPVDAVRWRVYQSPPDDDTLRLQSELPISTTSVVLGYGALGRPLETAWLFPMLPCHTLRYGHGRLLGLSTAGLVWSEPYSLGLMRDSNHLGMQGGCLLEPVGEGGDGAGWFVSDFKRTYFMAGADPKQWNQVVRYAYPAVPGSSLTRPGTNFGLETEAPVALWLSANGVWCLGLPGGQVQPLREGQLALPVDCERAASGYFEFDGVRQVVTSMLGGAPNKLNAAAGDEIAAEVRRNGVVI